MNPSTAEQSVRTLADRVDRMMDRVTGQSEIITVISDFMGVPKEDAFAIFATVTIIVIAVIWSSSIARR